MSSIFDELIISHSASVKNAMAKLDITAKKIVFVIDKYGCLVGSLSDGDIRRWILKGGQIKDSVEEACYKDTFFVKVGYDVEAVKRTMMIKSLSYVPIIDNENKIIDFVSHDRQANMTVPKNLNSTVVIMAGGKGTRLDPFTKILPKPLIPIHGKTMLEHIIDKFLEYNVGNFYLSINHKAAIIKSYFEEVSPDYTISYITEDKPLGTIGAIKKIESESLEHIFVTNCDILVKADYCDVLKQHIESCSDITMVVSMKHFKIPYGVCIIEKDCLGEIIEKPEYDFMINTGMYVISKRVLKMIPDDEYFDATQLIDAVKKTGGKVGVYPISENSWVDVGEWAEYKKALESINI